ncbi:MAG TPA: hypothetical protein VM221_13315 [Armatimonadota bacterium]|nr:hypothetical protein [Armatimonadota bacterium]
MGTLTEQMRNLAADITSSRDERHAWLGALKEEVGGLRAEIRSGCRERRSWVKSLQGGVRKMCRETRADVQGARGAWQDAIAAGARSGAETSPPKHAKLASKHRK